jgi:glutamyl-Q tRNA(Asp) synthetase
MSHPRHVPVTDQAAPIVTRFAPSPTGFLHLGHAHAALFAWRRARRARGRFVLRIEDIDAGRCRPAFTDAIFEDLAWLGLDWDDTPRMQSAHLPDYAASLESLRARRLLYPCFCTRAEIAREIAAAATAPHGPDGAPRYPGTCRTLSEAEQAARIASGAPYALRLDMERALASLGGETLWLEAEGEGRVAADPAPFGDVTLGRRDAPVSYHLCATQDDAAQGVTLVTRADDLRAADDLHRLLQALMGWPAPAYAHFPLLTGRDGRRLSKRDDATTLRSLRAAGRTPAEVRAMAGFPHP